jgi:hypothetical protein
VAVIPGQVITNAIEWAKRTPWPIVDAAVSHGAASPRRPVAVVTVNFNTRTLVSHLLFSLYRVLGRDQFTTVVVVDNGSSDDSTEYLRPLAAAGLIELLENRRQRYHGPGLNQALTWLARRARDRALAATNVWILDSDTVVLSPDVVGDAVQRAADSGAALLGQLHTKDEATGPYLNLASLLVDPVQAWRWPTPPFHEHGNPILKMERSLEHRGRRIVEFPFFERNLVLHLGRGTLRGIALGGDTSNRYLDWARDHYEFHYHGNPDGPELHREFLEHFDQEVGRLTPEALVAACERPDLIAPPGRSRR